MSYLVQNKTGKPEASISIVNNFIKTKAITIRQSALLNKYLTEKEKDKLKALGIMTEEEAAKEKEAQAEEEAVEKEQEEREKQEAAEKAIVASQILGIGEAELTPGTYKALLEKARKNLADGIVPQEQTDQWLQSLKTLVAIKTRMEQSNETRTQLHSFIKTIESPSYLGSSFWRNLFADSRQLEELRDIVKTAKTPIKYDDVIQELYKGEKGYLKGFSSALLYYYEFLVKERAGINSQQQQWLTWLTQQIDRRRTQSRWTKDASDTHKKYLETLIKESKEPAAPPRTIPSEAPETPIVTEKEEPKDFANAQTAFKSAQEKTILKEKLEGYAKAFLLLTDKVTLEQKQKLFETYIIPRLSMTTESELNKISLEALSQIKSFIEKTYATYKKQFGATEETPLETLIKEKIALVTKEIETKKRKRKT